MKCIIIEDQLPAQRILKKFISDYESLNLIGVFNNGIEAMEFVNKNEVDLMFLDIHLPKLSGIDFLKALNNPPQVIFTTAFSEFALEGYELNVVDYLLKPFSFQRFVQAVSKVRTTKEENGNHEQAKKDVFIKSGFEHIRIKINEINYIMSDADYTEVHLENAKHLSTETLRYWEQTLPEQQFKRVHKSYIVNTEKVLKVSGNQIYLENKKIIPLGRAFKNGFLERFIG
ncbi:LytR/AlgR family response regulator transcription factor [Brumimicrobium aurantiacum]|uniref:DNA-binding response regulator n=1 Tax=Brumimicrobium aurantiacum TaxID=1737063 RepID=A0A3E1F1J4_9FLAO|nr:LytTR family transcriptional regulator DNA-binding domain-containing protein [Brumimicrobium aurantiacum]RFC55688.1 DNA-binding response regulator [Brumimicrobium aurantiacum]